MIKLGVTGGIGSGKTTVCRLLEKFGVPVYYADTEAKNLMNADTEIRNTLSNWFGSDLYASGSLDRGLLASYIFSDKEQLERVNHLVHPRVAAHFKNWMAKQQATCIAKEAAILFESGSYKEMDVVLTVNAPEELRIARVMKRDAVSREEVIQRLTKQWTDKQRSEKADYHITNDDNTLVLPQLIKLLKGLKIYEESI